MKLLRRYSGQLYGAELPYNSEIQQNDLGHAIKTLI